MERTKIQKDRRRYKLHYLLRKAGYLIVTSEKTIKQHHVEFQEESTPQPFKRYIEELRAMNYEVQSSIN